jgi:hypothetical protein
MYSSTADLNELIIQVPRQVLAQSITGAAEGKQFYLDSVSELEGKWLPWH